MKRKESSLYKLPITVEDTIIEEIQVERAQDAYIGTKQQFKQKRKLESHAEIDPVAELPHKTISIGTSGLTDMDFQSKNHGGAPNSVSGVSKFNESREALQHLLI